MPGEGEPRAPLRALAVRLASACGAGVVGVGLDRLTAAVAGVDVPLALGAAVALAGGLALAAAAIMAADALLSLGRWAIARAGASRLAAVLEGLAWAGLVAWPAWLLGQDLTAGDWIARQSWAPTARVGVAIVSSVVALLASLSIRRVRARGRARPGHSIALAVGAVALALADGLVLPGLYPAAHEALFILAFVAVLLSIANGLDALLPAGARPRLLLAVATPSLILLALSPVPWIDVSPATRSSLMLASPHAGPLVPFVSKPPRIRWLRRELLALGDTPRRRAPSRPPPARTALPVPADWNIVLVTVDALRVDALPALQRSDLIAPRDVPFLTRWLAGFTRFRNAYAQASQTKRSLPPMFRSSQPYENPLQVAEPLPQLMEATGRTPVAVVPQYFLEPAAAESRRLLDGFEGVGVYPDTRQEVLLDEARRVFGTVRDQPFFAWVHFYATHHPWYAGRETTAADGTARHRYQLAMHWLDDQLRQLDRILRELGVDDRSVIVLASDHGEPLGERGRVGHGWTIWESDIHVPLAIRVPGRRGADVDALVGNIDVVPTLLELAGGRPHPDHRGRSLAPLMVNPRAAWDFPYYLRSGIGNVHGLVHDGQKLVWQTRARHFMRFDLRRDPGERQDVFEPDSPIDRALVGTFVRTNPAFFARELEHPTVQRLLVRRLGEIDPRAPGESLDFLLELLRLKPLPEGLAIARRILERTDDLDVLVGIVDRLLSADGARVRALLERRLSDLEGRPEQLELVEAIARRGRAALRPAWAAEHLAALVASPDPRVWSAWLQAVLPLRKSAAEFAPILARLLQHAPAGEPALVALVLANVAAIDGQGALPEAVASQVLPLLDAPDLRLRLAAIAAAGRTKGDPIEARLRARLAAPDTDLRERQALVHALARVAGTEATPAILEAARDPLLVLDVVAALAKLKDPRSLPFLREVAKGRHAWYTRKRAATAVEQLERARP